MKIIERVEPRAVNLLYDGDASRAAVERQLVSQLPYCVAAGFGRKRAQNRPPAGGQSGSKGRARSPLLP
ncbi:MAG TPA: hypothetical protein VMW17_15020 [Candidatus Binatia bacterium]|nr:hypothetical protein [Candidatus Binatia bacterium]